MSRFKVYSGNKCFCCLMRACHNVSWKKHNKQTTAVLALIFVCLCVSGCVYSAHCILHAIFWVVCEKLGCWRSMTSLHISLRHVWLASQVFQFKFIVGKLQSYAFCRCFMQTMCIQYIYILLLCVFPGDGTCEVMLYYWATGTLVHLHPRTFAYCMCSKHTLCLLRK